MRKNKKQNLRNKNEWASRVVFHKTSSMCWFLLMIKRECDELKTKTKHKQDNANVKLTNIFLFHMRSCCSFYFCTYAFRTSTFGFIFRSIHLSSALNWMISHSLSCLCLVIWWYGNIFDKNKNFESKYLSKEFFGRLKSKTTIKISSSSLSGMKNQLKYFILRILANVHHFSLTKFSKVK